MHDMQGNTHVETISGIRVEGRAGARIAVLIAATLGTLVIWTVGFSHIEALHNAAHDTRHSNAFPCH
jgi:cobalt transporter subunit CbtB